MCKFLYRIKEFIFFKEYDKKSIPGKDFITGDLVIIKSSGDRVVVVKYSKFCKEIMYYCNNNEVKFMHVNNVRKYNTELDRTQFLNI